MSSPDQRSLDAVTAAVEELLPSFVPAGAGVITSLRPGGGNAGFSYLFEVRHDEESIGYYLRLAPPGVRHSGTADVRRQQCALSALDHSDVPHAQVVAGGEHPSVGPYMITTRVPGTSMGLPDALAPFSSQERAVMGASAMRALVGVHRIDWESTCDYLGGFEGDEQQVTRWDRFFAMGEYRDDLAVEQSQVRDLLLATLPSGSPLSLCHGDYQFGNLMFEGTDLTAVIDWELCGIAPGLSDLGWVMAFHDERAWGELRRESARYFSAADMRGWYDEAGGLSDSVEWFQALAHYKYAVIASLNLMLHRRGKREDPEWETRGPAAFTHMSRALEILGDL